MKIHWAAHIDYDHDGNDDEHFSACGVGRGQRDGEEWDLPGSSPRSPARPA